MTRKFCARLVLLLAVVLAALAVAGVATAAPIYNDGAYISGGPYVGTTLEAHEGSWTYTAPVTFAFTWTRNGSPIGLGPAYTLTNADVGQSIGLQVSAKDASGDTWVSTNAASPTTPQWPPAANNVTPTVTGDVKAGAAVTANPGGWFLTNPAQPDPIAFLYSWYLDPYESLPGANDKTLTLPADAGGKTLHLTVIATVPAGNGGLSYSSVEVTAPVGSGAPPPPPPGPTMLTSTTNIAAGSEIKGTVHWTVAASGTAYRTSFYNDNQFIRDAVGTGNNWAIDLDTTKYTDGVHQLGYDIYNQAGERVFIGKHIQVTIKNTTSTPPPPTPPTPPSGGGGSGGSGGSGGGGGSSGGGTPSTPPAQTPPLNVPQPTPPKVTPPISRGGTLKLLVGGFAQTAARRGDQFAVAMFVIRSDTGKQVTTGKVTCALAGKRLVWHGWYHKAAGCRWAIPANAELGHIAGSFSVTAKGLTLKRKFTANVKRQRVAV